MECVMMDEFNLGDIQKAATECRLEAAELQRRASTTRLPSDRRSYLESADDFLRLAEGYERHLDLKQSVDRIRQLRARRETAAELNRKAS
jgi:hypothetical protein